jgi:hypothetical protein
MSSRWAVPKVVGSRAAMTSTGLTGSFSTMNSVESTKRLSP